MQAACAQNLFDGNGREGENEREQFREMIHERVDQWIDELMVVFDEKKQPTLMDLSDLFTATRHKLLGECLQTLIESKYRDLMAQERSPCPKCGKVCKMRRNARKEILTMQGPSTIIRPWFYCTHCSHGFAPLDEALELSRNRTQFDIEKKTTRTAAQVPFLSASEILEDLSGQRVSDHFIHESFEEVGAQASLSDIIPSKDEINRRIDKVTDGNWRPILVVASDGAHLPTRPKAKRNERRGAGKYKEAKGFRIYLVGEDWISPVASWHQIQDEEQFGEDLALAASRIDQERVRIALLGDGADWLWKHMVALFPKGRQILDYYHCAEYIYDVAKAQHGEKSIKGLEWVEATLCRLYFAETDQVVKELKEMKPKDEAATEQIRKTIVYLTNNSHRIHYSSDRLGGYPIGSGGIESANKFICHTRMKRSGAWWVKETGNEMLKIRCAIYNRTYDLLFDRYKRAKIPTSLRPLTNG